MNANAVSSRIEHRALRVSLVNGFATVLTLLFQLISVPVCLTHWGKESYGGWLALSSAFLMLRSLDGGFVTYVGNKLNYLYHKDTDALREHLSSAIAGVIVVNVLQLVLASAALVYHPLALALGVASDGGDPSAPWGLFLLIVSWVLTGSYMGIVHRLLIPVGMMYQSAWWAMVFQITQFAATMAAALLKLGMLPTSILFAATQMAVYVASAVYIRHTLPGLYPWIRRVNRGMGLRDFGHSIFLTCSNIVQQCALNGIILLIAALAGPVAVPIFTTVRTVSNLWTSVTTVLTTPLLPEVIRIHAQGDVAKLAAINGAFWAVVGSAVNAGALLLFPVIPLLYGRWTGHAVALNSPLLCLMLASVLVTNAGALMALHLNGINSLRIVLAASVARAVCSLGLGALGYPLLGLASFGLGVLAGELAALAMTARHFLKYEIDQKGFSLSAIALGPVSLGTGSALTYFVGAGFGWWSGISSWLAALCAVGVAAIWGWRSLELDLRQRLCGMAASWTLRFSPSV